MIFIYCGLPNQNDARKLELTLAMICCWGRQDKIAQKEVLGAPEMGQKRSTNNTPVHKRYQQGKTFRTIVVESPEKAGGQLPEICRELQSAPQITDRTLLISAINQVTIYQLRPSLIVF